MTERGVFLAVSADLRCDARLFLLFEICYKACLSQQQKKSGFHWLCTHTLHNANKVEPNLIHSTLIYSSLIYACGLVLKRTSDSGWYMVLVQTGLVLIWHRVNSYARVFGSDLAQGQLLCTGLWF